ncbi:MAG TPA: tetratricopeptide repeat protein [Candidatus Krumholzibacterium sp.]|nr:tetratricopeptide repeat protein [Candidatus Krumholzibacterium sp.]
MRRSIRAVLLAAIAMPFMISCSGEGNGDLYRAEKDLYSARKLNGELVLATMNREFLDRTIDAYRKVVSGYSSMTGSIDGMEMIVVSAQMELAELEFRAGMLEAAREDFLTASAMAVSIEEARANAVWSAAYISMEMGDLERSLSLFEKFVDDFLTPEKAERTFRMNGRYLVTPIRIAELNTRLGDEKRAKEWFDRAVSIYQGLIASSGDSLVVRETRYDLLTARLQGGDWNGAAETVAEMKRIYANRIDTPSLLFIEAKVEAEGLGRTARAVPALRKIIDEYPDSHQKLPAMLMLASLHMKEGRLEEAVALYGEILEKHGNATREAAEASWQMAAIAESQGNWVDASLHYKSTYTNYPSTVQGMESPIRIASHFREIGESAAAAGAYARARELYERLMSEQYGEGIRIMAEEYYIRSLSEEKKWAEAAERLLGLPDRYPDYHKFRQNYLLAASIYEKEMGDTAKAVSVLERCVSDHPDSPLAGEAQRQLDRIRGKN